MSVAATHEILQNSPGTRACLLGNLGIVRGALEAGVQFFACYPGTPSSEVGDTFAAIAKDAGVFDKLTLEQQRSLLLEILDHNALYVNLSEIDDTDYAVSEEDKLLNAEFYGQED